MSSTIFQKFNFDYITKTISDFLLELSFVNMKINEMVYLFENILTDYILHKVTTCDDKDPSWINETIASLI